MTARRLRVLKLGGSLLDLPDLAVRVGVWLEHQPAAANVFVAGGGGLVDELRQWHRRDPLDPVLAHWLCVLAMSATARTAAQLLGMELVFDVAACRALAPRSPCVLDVERFVSDECSAGQDPLPCSWDVSSDSIAARLAARLAADELVLLKSTLPWEPRRLETLAASGYVDRCFPCVAANLRKIRAVNLRSVPSAEVCLTDAWATAV